MIHGRVACTDFDNNQSRKKRVLALYVCFYEYSEPKYTEPAHVYESYAETN